jgi:hypothetical protein
MVTKVSQCDFAAARITNVCALTSLSQVDFIEIRPRFVSEQVGELHLRSEGII